MNDVGTDSTGPRPIAEWRRLATEGLVIVSSILLAFAIDASWDAARERSQVRRQLATVAAEVAANRAVLVGMQPGGEESLEALQEIVDIVRPSGTSVSTDSLARLLYQGFNAGYASSVLETSALAQLLSQGDFQASISPDLYQALVSFRSASARFQGNADEFADNRERIISYLSTVSPVAFVSAATGAHAPTDFPVPVEALLRDPQLEGLIGNLAVRARSTGRVANRLVLLADSIEALANLN